MIVEKKPSTHLVLREGATLHVEGTRRWLTDLVEALSYKPGIDLPILVKVSSKAVAFQRARLWIGTDLLRSALIADEHEVDVSEAPLNPVTDVIVPDGAPAMPDEEPLEVVFG